MQELIPPKHLLRASGSTASATVTGAVPEGHGSCNAGAASVHLFHKPWREPWLFQRYKIRIFGPFARLVIPERPDKPAQSRLPHSSTPARGMENVSTEQFVLPQAEGH